MPIGKCALCLREGVELQDSHILSKFAYRRVVEKAATGATAPTVIADGNAVITNRQIKEHLLCTACEGRFSLWEDVVAKLVNQEDGTFPWHALLMPDPTIPGLFRSDAVDRAAVVKCAASIVWRAHVSKEISQVDLGPYADKFRRFLFDDTALFPDHVFLHVSLSPAHDDAVRRALATPITVPAEGGRAIWFPFVGATFMFFIGKILPPFHSQACFHRTGRLNVNDGKGVLSVMERMVAESVPRGKQARLIVKAKAGRK